MRVSTNPLPSVSAVSASYNFKNSHLRFNCNLAVYRNKTLFSQIQLCQKFNKPLFERSPLIPNNIRKCSYTDRYFSASGNYISNFSVFSGSICGSSNSENLGVAGYSVYFWRKIIQSYSLFNGYFFAWNGCLINKMYIIF